MHECYLPNTWKVELEISIGWGLFDNENMGQWFGIAEFGVVQDD